MPFRRGDIDMGGKHGRHTASLLDAALCRLANDWHVADIADKQAAVLAFFRVPSMTHGHAIATAVEADTRHLKTEWVVGVDKWGEVFIIAAPDIAPHFLEYRTAEEICITPHERPDLCAGVYLMECEYEENRDPETGRVDDYYFHVVKELSLSHE